MVADGVRSSGTVEERADELSPSANDASACWTSSSGSTLRSTRRRARSRRMNRIGSFACGRSAFT